MRIEFTQKPFPGSDLYQVTKGSYTLGLLVYDITQDGYFYYPQTNNARKKGRLVEGLENAKTQVIKHYCCYQQLPERSGTLGVMPEELNGKGKKIFDW